MMTNLEQQLENLYIQKNKIEEEIQLVKEQIKAEKESVLVKKKFSKDEKIELFKSLFVGRFDIYAKKWVSRDGNKQGFYPVTATFQGEDYLPLLFRMHNDAAIATILPGCQFFEKLKLLFKATRKM